MRIEMTPEGPVVPAEDLGPLLGIEPSELPRMMRDGIVTARHEIGMDADAGRFRLSFRYGATTVRLTCAEDGTVISSTRVSAERAPLERS